MQHTESQTHRCLWHISANVAFQKLVARWQFLNIAEAKEPHGHTKLKTQSRCWTYSGFHTEAHESFDVFALVLFSVFFFFTTVSKCVSISLYRQKKLTLCCVCLWEGCICLSSKQKTMPSKFNACLWFYSVNGSCFTELLDEWGVPF